MERKGILQFMKNCLDIPNYNQGISNNKRVIKLIKRLLEDLYKHYRFSDLENRGTHGSYHQLRFSLLYMDETDMSYAKIAEETFLRSSDTVKYYAKLYNESVLDFVEEESNINSDYTILLEEYLKSGL